MNTTAHTLISSTIATGLAFFTFLSALIAGLGSTITITGLSLFVAVGIIEIMIQSYAQPRGVLSGPRRGTATPPAPHGVMIPFPTSAKERKAA